MAIRNAILVVGAPRSGTSAVCHVLNECGISFGDPAKFVDPATNAHNPMFFELVELNELNERMMARMGWSYSDFNALPLRGDFDSALADEFEQDVASLISQFGDAFCFGLKDPRFCFTLPLWVGLLSRHGIKSRILRVRRDPEAVASSNFRLSPERGIEYGRRIALLSDSAAAYFLRDVAHETIRFEGLYDGEPGAVQALAATASVEEAKVRLASSRAFRNELVHWRSPVAANGVNDEESAADYESLCLLIRKFGLRPGVEGGGSQDAGKAVLAQIDVGLAPPECLPFVQGPVQVYYRREDEVFVEDRSVVVPWPSRDWEETIAVELPDACGEYFRIDVNASPGAYAIRALSIDGAEVMPLSVYAGANGAAYELPDGTIGLVANHGDPWVYFRSPHGAASSLTVRIQRMAPEEIGRRLFSDRRIEQVIDGLQQRMSQFDDRVIERMSRLHHAVDENGERQVARLTGIETSMSQKLLGGITRLDELYIGQAELQKAQKAIEEVQAREAVRMLDTFGLLEEMRRIALMGWWSKRKLRKGSSNKP